MNIIILASQNINYLPLNEWLNNCEENIYLFVKEEHKIGYLEKIKRDNFKIYSFKNWKENWNLESTIIKLSEKIRFDKLICISESDIERAADIREKLSIDGQHSQSGKFFRNKHYMKKLVSKNFPTPNFQLISNYFDIENFIIKHGYPIIIKPVDGSSSINTYKVYNNAELSELLEKNHFLGYLIEEFINGDVYHIDGILLNNELKFISCSRYFHDSLCYKDGKSSGSIFLKKESEVFNKLKIYTESFLKDIPTTTNMVFHLEVFIDTNNEIIFCEIASRTGGGQIANNINMEYGLHLTREYVRHECNMSSKVDYDHIERDWMVNRGFIMSTPLEGKLRKFPSNLDFPWVTNMQLFAVEGKVYSKELSSSVECVAAISCQANSESELLERLLFIDEWFKSNSFYEKF